MSIFHVTGLRAEGLIDPLGIDVRNPELSWRPGTEQKAWRVRAAAVAAELETGPYLWDSGWVEGSRSHHHPYGGAPLESRERVFWQVRIRNGRDELSAWSEPAFFEAGLLEEKDWVCVWTGMPGAWSGFARYFQSKFNAPEQVKTARLYISGLGWFEAYLNGRRLGDAVLDPAPTDCSKSVIYRVFDLAGMLAPGENVLAVHAGGGWHVSPIVRCQVELDGEVVAKTRPFGFLCGPSAITRNSIYGGEEYDARLEPDSGWMLPGGPALPPGRGSCRVDPPAGKMRGAMAEPIRELMELSVRSWQALPDGRFVADFGQNFAGYCRLKVKAPAGTRITLRFAEYCNEDGSVNQDNLLGDHAVDAYTACGAEEGEAWKPRFTYHGFRYVEVAGLPAAPEAETLTGIAVGTDCRPVGRFRTDNGLLNRIETMVQWTERSNLHGVPTDCPQRTERMGWLNDMMARCECALFHFDEANLLRKWLRDIAEAQDPETGFVPMTAPCHWTPDKVDPVCSSFVESAWNLHLYCGERMLLRELFPNFLAWCRCMENAAENHILIDGGEIGDWVPPVEFCPPGRCRSGLVPPELVSTALYGYAVSLTAKIAAFLGEEESEAALKLQFAAIRDAFHRRFHRGEGRYESGSQAAYCYALYCGMVPEELRKSAFAHLVERFEADGRKLTTGNIGTKYLLEILSESGRADLVFGMVNSTEYPGWGYMLANGATTLWERWEKATGSGMNSHNHPMLGSVGGWFYKYLAGIRPLPDSDGFDRFGLAPCFVEGLNEVEAQYDSFAGTIRSRWKREGDRIVWEFSVPPNSCAAVRQSDGTVRHYGAGEHTLVISRA